MHDLIHTYIALAEQWRCAMDEQDAEKANTISSRLEEYLRKIRPAGVEQEGRELVEHQSDAVRFFASAVLKTHRPVDAKKVYQELARSTLPYIAVSSKYIAKEL